MINSEIIQAATGIEVDFARVDGIGDLYAGHVDSIISYLVRDELLPILNYNDRISHVFCTSRISSLLPTHVFAIVCDDPTWAFFSVIDYLAASREYGESIIDPTSSTEGSWIATSGVQIGPRAKVEHFCSVFESTTIGADTLVRSGAAIGLDTFQHQRTTHGIISPRHDGCLKIGERAEIGANCSISRGFSYRDTIIGDDVKIDSNVSISHGVKIGKGSIICAGAMILGHSTIGENVFVGPGATVRNRVSIENGARVSIGSVVTQDVPNGKTVTGNFAVPHEDWLAFMKEISK